MIVRLRRVLALLSIALAALAPVAALAAAPAPEPVTLTAADGAKVFGDVWRAPAMAGGRRPVIVAFHQAESSTAEYAPIAPRLVQAGFTVLAIDQRQGGEAFGGKNRTVAARGGELPEYDAALPDLEAALAWGKREANGAPVVVWGSSYSASLVFLLAAAHPADVAGVVAFSPDEYLAKKTAVRDAAAKVAVPVYVSQSSDANEVAAAAAVVKAVRGAAKQQFVSKAKSIHGSATLRADANRAGAEAQWQAVLKFLSRFSS